MNVWKNCQAHITISFLCVRWYLSRFYSPKICDQNLNHNKCLNTKWYWQGPFKSVKDFLLFLLMVQSWALLFCQSPFYVKIDSFWARDLISCVNGCFWPKWRWVNSFFDFCPFRHTFLTFFENPKKPKMSFFELETWFFGGREVFDQYEHGSTHFFISALLRSKMALYS